MTPGSAPTTNSNPNATRIYTQEDIIRLKTLVNEGCEVLQEMDALKEGLNDTVKHIAEELNINFTFDDSSKHKLQSIEEASTFFL
jgi:hypothetical protein